MIVCSSISPKRPHFLLEKTDVLRIFGYRFTSPKEWGSGLNPNISQRARTWYIIPGNTFCVSEIIRFMYLCVTTFVKKKIKKIKNKNKRSHAYDDRLLRYKRKTLKWFYFSIKIQNTYEFVFKATRKINIHPRVCFIVKEICINIVWICAKYVRTFFPSSKYTTYNNKSKLIKLTYKSPSVKIEKVYKIFFSCSECEGVPTLPEIILNTFAAIVKT